MRAPRLCSQRTSDWGGLQRARRNASYILSVLVGVVGSAAGASGVTVEPSVSASTDTRLAATLSVVTEWEDILLWYLLWLYETLGGDPGVLRGQTPVQAMSTVSVFYHKNGLSGVAEAKRVEFLHTLEQLWAHLHQAPPCYDGPALTEFGADVQSMYVAAGGEPGRLS